VRGPTGALIIGDPEKVVEKILYVNEALGGLTRVTFQMGVSALPHQKMLRSIELLGTRVAPILKKGARCRAGACVTIMVVASWSMLAAIAPRFYGWRLRPRQFSSWSEPS
jgi:hypothetical protein